MPKLVQEPLITYKCQCGATSSAEPEEFKAKNTMPPTWVIKCAYCNLDVVCSPSAMISRQVGSMSDREVHGYLVDRLSLLRK